ncbi:hypothetical protein [Leptospira meyeri]|uniref:hypothetical protein n=1 Tax=Leptospira meyeri TaxID=29508 RepID=UPI00108247B1|nr:hypothetical protein [Leptospira meyeri]TGL16859.1 hypothetical protein EHQ50_00060 [Leptospira meyeri]
MDEIDFKALNKLKFSDIQNAVIRYLNENNNRSDVDRNKINYIDFDEYLIFGRDLATKINFDLTALLIEWYFKNKSDENLEIICYTLQGYINEKTVFDDQFIAEILTRVIDSNRNSNRYIAYLYILFHALNQKKNNPELIQKINIFLLNELPYLENERKIKNIRLYDLIIQFKD